MEKFKNAKPRRSPSIFAVCLFSCFALYHVFPEVLSLGKEVLKREEAQVEVLEGITKEKTHWVIFQNIYQWHRYHTTVRSNLPKGINSHSQIAVVTVRIEIFIHPGRSYQGERCTRGP